MNRVVISGGIEVSDTRAHLVEFYRTGDALIGSGAARFLGQALSDGGMALAYATPIMERGILRQLGRMGHDLSALLRAGRLTVKQSAGALSRMIERHAVVPEAFREVVADPLRAACAAAGDTPVHVFGDMAGMLWQRDERDLAVELESLGNRLQDELPVRIFCAYPVDVFDGDFCSGTLHDVLDQHTHVLSSPGSSQLGRALDRALDDVLGDEASNVRYANRDASNRGGPLMPQLERLIVWLRANHPASADAVMQRARTYYEDSAPRVFLR